MMRRSHRSARDPARIEPRSPRTTHASGEIVARPVPDRCGGGINARSPGPADPARRVGSPALMVRLRTAQGSDRDLRRTPGTSSVARAIVHRTVSRATIPSETPSLMSDIASSDPAVRSAPVPAPAGAAADGVPTVVIVDADDRTRASLVGLLAIRGRVRVVGDAGRASDAATIIRTQQPDVVVLDPRLPELEGGIALIRSVRSLEPPVRVLAMGPTGPIETASAEAGADAFVRKTFRADELADAVVRCATRIRSAGPSEPGRIL